MKIVVGAVVWEIQCCSSLASLKDLLRGGPGPTFNLTSVGLKCLVVESTPSTKQKLQVSQEQMPVNT